MVMVKLLLVIKIFTEASERIIFLTEKDISAIIMVLYMKENSNKVLEMGMEPAIILMAVFTRDIGWTTYILAVESLLMLKV